MKATKVSIFLLLFLDRNIKMVLSVAIVIDIRILRTCLTPFIPQMKAKPTFSYFLEEIVWFKVGLR